MVIEQEQEQDSDRFDGDRCFAPGWRVCAGREQDRGPSPEQTAGAADRNGMPG